jgi:transmembrane sensor
MTSTHRFDDAPDWETLARYRAGESAPDEAAAVSAWLREHAAEAELLAALDGALGEHLAPSRAGGAAVDVEGALAAMHLRLDTPPSTGPRLRLARGGQRGSSRATRRVIGGLAAAAVAAIAVGIGRESLAPRNGTTNATISGREYATPVGVVDSVTLSDGTQVILAPSSRLVVSMTYGRGARMVSIEGMARFAVSHDAAAPFTVRASNATIRDVGTRFVVRAPGGVAPRVSVAVLEGAVTVASSWDARSLTSLHAGDRAELQTDGGVVATRGAAGEGDDAWTRGRLVYRGAPLDLVRDDLRRWYGLELTVPDSSLAARRLTATFDDQSADQVVQTIALALGARVERTGAVVTLRAAAATP